MVAASATSRTIFTTPNVPFSRGTHGALRSPVSTPSCSVKMPQAITQTTNASPGIRAPSWAYEGPQCRTTSRKGMVTMTEASELKR
jgi:hypothetical protein